MPLKEILAKITNPDANCSPGSKYLPEEMAQLTHEEVVCLCTEAPSTLGDLAWAGNYNQPEALNAISDKLGRLTEAQVVIICTKAPNTLRNLAVATSRGFPAALDAISGKLGGLTDEQVATICTTAPWTLIWLARAAYNGFPEALNAISDKLVGLTEEQIATICTEHPRTLAWLAEAASKDSPKALNAISGKLGGLTGEQVASICRKDPCTFLGTLVNLARASQHISKEGCHPIDFFIARHFKDLSSLDATYQEKIKALQSFLAAPNNVEALTACSYSYPDVYLFLAESKEVGDRADGPAVKQSLLEASRSERLNRGEMIFSAVADYMLVDALLKDASKEKCARCEASYDSLKSALNSMSSLMVYFNKSQAEMENDIADKLGAMLGVYKSQLKVDKRFVQAFIENPPESFEDFKRVILGYRGAGLFAVQSVVGLNPSGARLPFVQ